LLEYAQRKLLEIEGLKVYGEKANRAGVVSFNLSGIGIASDVGMILDKLGIAVEQVTIVHNQSWNTLVLQGQ
jgi:cysteine desulfurase/selenocysteine lyase